MSESLLDSIEQTACFGKLLGALCLPGDIICLKGELGTGKTTLAQAIAKGVGVTDDQYVTSPTFAVFQQYSGRLMLYHMDFYRLNDSEDVLSMGLDEYFYLSGVTVVEWYQKALDIIPEHHLLVELDFVGDQRRKLRCTSHSDSWNKRLDILTEQLKT